LQKAFELPLLRGLAGEDPYVFRNAFHSDGKIFPRLHRDAADPNEIGRARADIGRDARKPRPVP
jgi:hypothetical protein